jgi:hypothetical protein
MKSISFRCMILFIVFVITSTGCNALNSDLAEFVPLEDSLFKITYSYPAQWKFTLSPYDPSIMTANIYPASRKAQIWAYIEVYLTASPDRDMAMNITRFLNTRTSLSRYIIVEDRTLEIDGKTARWFVMQTTGKFAEGPEGPYISEDIFLLSDDRYYGIGILYSSTETNTQFHDEFVAMVESIKFLP